MHDLTALLRLLINVLAVGGAITSIYHLRNRPALKPINKYLIPFVGGLGLYNLITGIVFTLTTVFLIPIPFIGEIYAYANMLETIPFLLLTLYLIGKID